MEKLFKAMKEYESNKEDKIRITFNSDGSGHCDGKKSLRLFYFDDIKDLLRRLEI